MSISSKSRSRKSSPDPHLSIDLKSICSSNPNQEEEFINDAIFQSPDRNIKYQDRNLRIINSNRNNQYSDENEYEPSIHYYSIPKQNVKHHHSHQRHSNFSQSSKQSSNHHNGRSRHPKNAQTYKAPFEFENNKFDIKIIDHQNEIPHDERYQLRNYNFSANANEDGNYDAENFDNAYQFNYEQSIEEEKSTNVRNYYTLSSFKPNRNENPKMIFYDSDQIDDSLFLFIEEEDLKEKFYQDARRRRHQRQKSHHHHRRRTTNSNYLFENQKNIPNKANRRSLNNNYKKYMISNVARRIEDNNNIHYIDNNPDENIINKRANILHKKDGSSVKKGIDSSFSEYSILGFSGKSPPVNHFCSQGILSSNNSNSVTVPSSRKGALKNQNVNELKGKIKFADSDDISSGKIDDYLYYWNDSNNTSPRTENIESDQPLNEDINLKITFKDTNSNNQEKTQQYSILSSKNNQELRDYYYYGTSKIEEEEEENDFNQINDNKISNFDVEFHFETRPQDNNKLLIDDKEAELKMYVNMNNDSILIENDQSKNDYASDINSIKEDFKANNSNIEEEEENNETVLSFNSQDQNYDNQKDDDVVNAEEEEEQKEYKSVEINVRLKDIREAINSVNTKKKIVQRKRQMPKKRQQPDTSDIVTTHRKKMKKSRFRKKLVDRYVQTDEVDQPELTLDMLRPFY